MEIVCPQCRSIRPRSERISEGVWVCACSVCRMVFTIRKSASMSSTDMDADMLSRLVQWLQLPPRPRPD
jgi:ribosomal protein L37AE/L43A